MNLITPRKKRITSLAALTAAVALVGLATSARAQTYHFTDLGTLGGSGTTSSATALNNLGQVVGTSETAGGQSHAFLYSNGTMTDLQTLGGTESTALAINDAGIIVGTSRILEHGEFRPFIYSTGPMTELDPTRIGLGSSARGINNSNQIVGNGFFESSPVTPTADYPSLHFAAANAINNSGQIAGYYLPQNGGHSHAFLYSGGTFTDIGASAPSDSYGLALNASQDVVGYFYTTNFHQHAFLYRQGVFTDLYVLGDTTGQLAPILAKGINSAGQFVGASGNGPFLYEDGTIKPLSSLVDDLPAGWELNDATAINDAGQIVGTATNFYDEIPRPHAFLLTPIPEPTSLFLITVASPLLITRRRR